MNVELYTFWVNFVCVLFFSFLSNVISFWTFFKRPIKMKYSREKNVSLRKLYCWIHELKCDFWSVEEFCSRHFPNDLLRIYFDLNELFEHVYHWNIKLKRQTIETNHEKQTSWITCIFTRDALQVFFQDESHVIGKRAPYNWWFET